MRLKSFYRIAPSEWRLTANPDVSAAQKKALASPHLTEHDIEEYVRQWVLAELIQSYAYPDGWLGNRIIVEETVPVATADKQSDISIKNDRRRTYLFVETKASGTSKAEFERAERQLETYLSATHTATVGMLTDGDQTRVIRKKVNPNDFEYIADIPHFESPDQGRSRLVRDLSTIRQYNSNVGLPALPQRSQGILFEAHSAIRDIDGLHDDNALDELAKLIYAKIYDERLSTELDPGIQSEFRFQAYGKSSASEVASDIRDLYQEACEYDLRVYSQRIPGYERSRGVFKEQIGLSDVAVSAVVERLQDYSIIDADVDIKSAAFQKVLGRAIRAGMGQHFTPDEVVRIGVEVLRPSPHDLILDPFCGSGHFLSRSLDYVTRNFSMSDQYSLYKFRMFHLHGIEKSARMVRIAMTDMLMHNDGHSNIRNTDSLLTFDNYPDILGIPDDDNQDPQVFSAILTNPPFGSQMREEARRALGRFELGSRRRSLPLEVIALERCYQFLKPGGRLAIVLPDGNLANSNVQFVRDWLLDHMLLKGVVSLPSETFAPYGTTTKTSLCFFQKFRDSDDSSLDNSIAFYRLDNIGYDATGRPRDGSEVNHYIEYLTSNLRWEEI